MTVPEKFCVDLLAAFPWGEDEEINGGDLVEWIGERVPVLRAATARVRQAEDAAARRDMAKDFRGRHGRAPWPGER